MKHLIFDTETSGMVKFDSPISDPGQPHIIQLACELYNSDLEPVSSFCSLIKPKDWTIDPKAQEVHGISFEDCENYGLPIEVVLCTFSKFASVSDIVVAHNHQFDRKMLEIECYRNSMGDFHDWQDPARNFCTMKSSTALCRIPGNNGRWKWPKLSEAYRFFTGRELEDAHDALVDVRGCLHVYKALRQNLFKAS